jgi:hypothetical protein
MVAVPAETPAMSPVPLTVATPELLLLQVPPVVASATVVLLPAHTAAVPVIADGTGLTVTTLVTLQLVPREYVMIAEPSATPPTMPVAAPTVATDVLLLLQVPPPASVSAIVLPRQALLLPAMGPGPDTMVTVDVETQPEGRI